MIGCEVLGAPWKRVGFFELARSGNCDQGLAVGGISDEESRIVSRTKKTWHSRLRP